MDTLPVELLHEIFLSDVLVWKSSVLAIPFLHRRINFACAKKKFTTERDDGYKKEYFVRVNNVLVRHRREGPAIVWKGGGEEWFCNGVLHRDGGPAVFFPDRDHKEWWRMGKLHREDGPAVSRENYQAWYKNGVRHRDGDLPAVIWNKDGKKILLFRYKDGLIVKSKH